MHLNSVFLRAFGGTGLENVTITTHQGKPQVSVHFSEAFESKIKFL